MNKLRTKDKDTYEGCCSVRAMMIVLIISILTLVYALISYNINESKYHYFKIKNVVIVQRNSFGQYIVDVNKNGCLEEIHFDCSELNIVFDVNQNQQPWLEYTKTYNGYIASGTVHIRDAKDIR